jgi:hypothetical protein
VVADLDVLDAGDRGERVGAERVGEGQLDLLPGVVAQGRDVVEVDDAPVAHDRDPFGDDLHLGEHVRGHEDGRTVGGRLTHHRQELLLQQRVQAAGRLVEDQQFGRVQERLDHADLLLVALRQAADRLAQVEPEPLRERVDAPGAAAATQPNEVLEQLPGRRSALHRELARQVPDPRTHGRPARGRRGTEHLGVPGGRSQLVEQDPDRGRLARAIGAEEAEHLTPPDLEVEPVERADAAGRPAAAGRPVVLDQPFGADHDVPGSVVTRGGGGHGRCSWWWPPAEARASYAIRMRA